MPNETDLLLKQYSEDESEPVPAPSSSTNHSAKSSPAEIPLSLRWSTNILALMATFFFSGIIFGWAPLELILLREGQYGGLCDSTDASSGSGGDWSGNLTDEGSVAFQDLDPVLLEMTEIQGAPLCSEQTNSLSGMFTAGQFFLNFLSFPVGMALDSLPKYILLTVCGIVQITGLVLLGISDTTGDTSRDYFYVAYALLAMGGSATMLSAFPASFLLKKYQAGLLALISCLFDASSVIFSVFKALQDKFGWTREDMFVAYTIWAAVIYIPLVICWIILERRNWQKIIEDEDRAEEALSKNVLEGSSPSSEYDFASANPNYVAHVKRIQNMSLLDQIKTKDFVFTMFFVATHMLQCNYYVMAVDAFLLSLGDDDAHYATVFGWALPCGIFFVPFIERTVTYLGVVNTLHTTNVFALVFAITLMVPNLNVQMINFFIFTCFRAYLYATINTLIAGTFGVQTMGRIIGVVFTTASVVGLVQYPMAVVSEVNFDGDYMPMNSLLVCVATLPALVTFRYGSYVSSSTAASMSTSDVPTIGHQKNYHSSSSRNPGLILTSPGRELVDSIRRARQIHNEVSDVDV